MKIYLSACYGRHAEMRGVRDFLVDLGHEVTSRWIDLHGGRHPVAFSLEVMNLSPELCAGSAARCLEDVVAADAVVTFTGGGGHGGRHVDFGVGSALGKRMIICGEREHIFHTLAHVEQCSTWAELVTMLERQVEGPDG